MTIWIIALVLIGLMAAAGYFLGTVRSAVTLFGVILGGLVALPLGPTIKPIFPQIGVNNPVWLWLLPPVLVFALVVLLSLVGGFLANLPVAKYFKFRSDDIQRIRWERLSARLGACMGLVGAFFCLLWLGAAVYGPGYLTVQFANNDTDPGWLRFMNRARTELAETGFDKVVTSLDPMPKKYYQVVDMLAFLYYNNPSVVPRLSAYPPCLSLAERQDVKDFDGDKEYKELLQKKPGLMDLINHAKTQALVTNDDLWQELGKLDLNDLRTYLEKGKSPKYDPLKLLGRWTLDADEVLLTVKKKKPDINAPELNEIKRQLAAMSAGTTFKATTDNRVEMVLRGNIMDLAQVKAPVISPVPSTRPVTSSAAPPSRGRPGGMTARGMTSRLSPADAQRYGTGTAAPPPPMAAPPTGAAPAPAGPPPIRLEVRTIQGSWEGDGDSYQLTLRDNRGQAETVDASVDGEQLSFTAFGQQFAFARE